MRNNLADFILLSDWVVNSGGSDNLWSNGGLNVRGETLNK